MLVSAFTVLLYHWIPIGYECFILRGLYVFNDGWPQHTTMTAWMRGGLECTDPSNVHSIRIHYSLVWWQIRDWRILEQVCHYNPSRQKVWYAYFYYWNDLRLMLAPFVFHYSTMYRPLYCWSWSCSNRLLKTIWECYLHKGFYSSIITCFCSAI